MKKSLLLSSFFIFALTMIGCTKKAPEVTLRLNVSAEPPTLHPGLASDATSINILRQTFEGLMTLGKNAEIVNGVAESYTMSKDGLVYTFKIRPNAKWSNGDPVTAQDFEYAWKWVLNSENNSPYSYQLYLLKNAKAAFEKKVSADQIGVKAIDAQTLEVTLANPTPYFLELTMAPTLFPVNNKIAQANPTWAKDAGTKYISNGPFKMTEWKHNNRITLEKNPNYWDASNIKLTKVTFGTINDSNTELQMLNNKELDWAGIPPGNGLSTEAISSLKAKNILHTQPSAGVYWSAFNTSKPPFNNANLRKAFTYAINRQSIVDNILQGGQLPAMANIPPTIFPENIKGYFKDNDVATAKEYLKKALDEMKLKSVADLPPITYAYNTNEGHRKVAQALQDIWQKELGIKVKLENFEWNVFLDKMRKGDHIIGRMAWLADFNDPVNFLELFEDPKGGNNFSAWDNKDFQALLASSRQELDPVKRKAILQQAEKVMIDEMPVAPIYFYTNSWIQNEKVKGVVVGPLGQFSLKYAYFEDVPS